MPELRSRPRPPDFNPNPITQPRPLNTSKNHRTKKKEEAEGGPVLETRSFELKEEAAGERAMDEYDSGGRSGDKGPAAEEEILAPIPDKVRSLCH